MAKLFLCFFLLSVPAFANREVGNGGDLYAKSFISIGYQLFETLSAQPLEEVSSSAFLKALGTVSVTSTDQELILRKRVVDAINLPKNLTIEFNRPSWDRHNYGEHASLVFHEYLGILGIDDTTFHLTRKMELELRPESWGRAAVDASWPVAAGFVNVLCKSGRFELVRAEDIDENDVCPGAAGARLPDRIAAISPEAEGRYSVLCRNLTKESVSGDVIVRDKACRGAGLKIVLDPAGQNGAGGIQLMSFSTAKAFCKQQGKRLPNLDELMHFALENGAQSYLKLGRQLTSETDKGLLGEIQEMKTLGYFYFPRLEGRMHVPDFYYNPIGFRMTDPPDVTGNSNIWSSEIYTVNRSLAFILSGYTGGLWLSKIRSDKNRARCISNSN